MTDDASAFLTAGFDGVPPEQFFLVWTLPDKKSRWYRGGDITSALNDIAELKDRDVYIAGGLSARNRGAKKRVEAADVSGIIGLWADIDIAESEAHKKTNLPPTEADARAVLDAMGAPPTVIIHSGHGLQAWWLFHEPWIFADDDERDEAARLSVRWFATMKVRAATFGWTIDATHDLSRVMRVPGTTNRKGLPVPVRILLAGGPTYDPSDFEQWIADDAAMSLLTGRRIYHVGELTLRADAQPNIDMRDALEANDASFAKTLKRERKDLSDTSPSGYDMAAARIAANAGWTDQQIVDLLIYARRRNNEDLKLNRLDYYQRTIARAREVQASADALSQLDSASDDLTRAVAEAELGGDGAKVPHKRRALLERLSEATGVAWVRVLRLMSEPPRWQAICTAGPLRTMSTKEFMSQAEMREAIAEKLKFRMDTMKPRDWDRVSQEFLHAADDEEIGFETTEAGLGYSWVNDYLQDRSILEDLDEALTSRLPYRDDDGTVFIIGDAIKKWLNNSRGERISSRRLGEVLRAYQCEYVKVNCRIDGVPTSRSLWKVPPSGEFTPPRYEEP